MEVLRSIKKYQKVATTKLASTINSTTIKLNNSNFGYEPEDAIVLRFPSVIQVLQKSLIEFLKTGTTI